MTDTSYLIAWLIYMATCVASGWLLWKMLQPLLRWPPYAVIAPLLALLLTPYFSDASQSRLAPAILTILFEGLFGDPQIALKAAMPLLLLLLPTLLIVAVLALRQRRTPRSS